MIDNFVSSAQLENVDSLQTYLGITTIPNKKENPFPQYKYFVRVGSGYRGFAKKNEANKYYKQD